MNTLRINTLAASVDRNATFVFILSDRLYGAAIALASGPEGDRYRFIRAVAVTLLKAMLPELQPLLEAPARRSAAEPRIVAFGVAITCTAAGLPMMSSLRSPKHERVGP